MEILDESRDTWYKVRRTGGLSAELGWLRGTHLRLDDDGAGGGGLVGARGDLGREAAQQVEPGV